MMVFESQVEAEGIAHVCSGSSSCVCVYVCTCARVYVYVYVYVSVRVQRMRVQVRRSVLAVESRRCSTEQTSPKGAPVDAPQASSGALWESVSLYKLYVKSKLKL